MTCTNEVLSQLRLEFMGIPSAIIVLTVDQYVERDSWVSNHLF